MNYHHTTIKLFKFQALFLLCLFSSILHTEEVGKLYYTGDIGEVKDSTIIISEEGVALSERIVIEVFDSLIFLPPQMTSIFLLIDHSGGMCYDYGPAHPDYPIDQWGERFIAAYNIIDTLKKYLPSAEVGLAVFREHLYFDPVDNPYFVQRPEYDTGAYMPFFKLDSMYAPDGKMGWQILQELLEIDTILASDDPLKPPECPDNYQYVNLKYKPSNYESNGLSRNINAAFDAAKYAFPSALYPRNRHCVFLFLGGEATVANGPHTDVNHFVGGEGVPSTFTLFFTHDTSSSPQSLNDMNYNIQANGYSVSNPNSNLWKININQQDLFQLTMFILSSIITCPHPHIVIFRPVDITINGIVYVDNWDSVTQTFTFNKHFPLVGVPTAFEYKTNYTGVYDSITPQGDTIVIQLYSTQSGEFNIAIQDGADLPDNYPHDFFLHCWDREMGFYYKNTLMSSLNMGIDTLEMRFTEKKVDVFYGYDSISVTITNSKGIKDSEAFDLTKTDSCFTKLFALTVDSTPTQNDGVLQVYERDTVTAIFKNPKLPLDIIKLSIPFYPTTGINPNTNFSNSKFRFIITKTGSMQNILRVYNLPENGKVSLYAVNGRKIFGQSIYGGTSSLLLPKSLSQSIYLINLQYGDIILREKILLR